MQKSKFESCINVITTLKDSPELTHSKIYYKTRGATPLRGYLDFLLSIDFIGSRAPQKSENCNGHPRAIYFLKEKGYEFLRSWENFKAEHKIDELEEQLIKSKI